LRRSYQNLTFAQLFILFTIVSSAPISTADAQKKGFTYTFTHSLDEIYGKGPALVTVETEGRIEDDYVPELQMVKKVYKFESNGGLVLTYPAVSLIDGSYSIELFFRLTQYNAWKRVIDFKNEKSDTGPYIYFRKISFYRTQSNDITPIKPDQYIHYIITRDSTTKMVEIFVDGSSRIKFKDEENLAVVDQDHRLNFFHDNVSMGNEASAGAVAYIKINNYVVKADEAKKNYDNLAKTFNELSKIPPLPKNKEIAKTPPKPLADFVPRPTTEIIFRGKVFNSKNQAAVDAKMKLEYVNGSALEGAGNTHKATGFYLLKLVPGKKYVYTVSAEGYLDYFDTLDLSNAPPNKEIVEDIYLEPIQIGQAMTLTHISFAQSEYALLPSSYPELDRLVSQMKANREMEIEVNGHTDNQGNAKLNVELSENRVKAVKDYLISKGIDSKRIKGKGYGGAKPIASNAKEETRKLNRRVEFTILKY
jgi:outer membrane protein OmpA-like peptidoglycan-associated protein